MHRIFLALLLLLLASLPATAGWYVDFETGAAFNGYNDVQIPNDATGTRFSLADFNRDPIMFFRARVGYEWGNNLLVALIAPTRFHATGRPKTAINFAGASFSASEDLAAIYRFDSYRLTYRYSWGEREKLRWGLGLTVKIRDAQIRVENPSTGEVGEKLNTGFVPLINFAMEWRFSDPLALVVDVDALGFPGSPGRAEDVLIALQYRFDDALSARVGWRFVEGGADGKSAGGVYSFTFISYWSAGATWKF